MNEQAEVFSEDEAWRLLHFHFAEPGGLFDQIDKGRVIDVKMGDTPEECPELQAIQQALQGLNRAWETTTIFPKWQVALLWSVVPRLEDMLPRYPQHALMLHMLHAKLVLWMYSALYTREREYPTEMKVIHDVTFHMKGLRSFCNELRFGKIDMEAFEELVRAVKFLSLLWRERTAIPRRAAWLFIYVPLADWDASVYEGERRKQLDGMRQLLYSCIEDCLRIN
ncbi:MAG TPA: hypothetical protein VKX46_06345 [Ktedonobacteraceae bacterium]|nr:hypothetical protein [Ktedonobacteraceae bacterium]